MNIILLDENDKTKDQRYRVTGKRATHICKILKADVGSKLKTGLVNGPLGTAAVESINAGEVVLKCTWGDNIPEPEKNIDIICAMPRPQTLKKVLQSCANMGVRNLHLVNANRTEKMYFSSRIIRNRNFSTYLREGLAQGIQTRLPEVFIHKRFRVFFEDTLSQIEAEENINSVKLLPELTADKNLSELKISETKKLILAIGPEGGWVPFEINLMKKAGFKTFKLGPWILRVENALVAAVSQLELALRIKNK